MSASSAIPVLSGRTAFAIFLILVCVGFRMPLEADPVLHMLIQMPLLAWAGWLLADAISRSISA